MSSFQNKMYNYEVSPPKNAWEKIANALDESNLSDKFPSTLHSLEVAPPAAAWDKIAGALDADAGIVIPMKRKAFPWIRLAVAAALVGIIALGIVLWMENKNTEPVNKDLVITKDSAPDKTKKVEQDNDVQADNNTNAEIINPEEPANIANAEPVKNPRTKKAKNTYNISENIDATQAIYAYNEHTPNLSDRYVMLMTPNGIVRMSKKLGNLVCCVSGEEQDENCKDQLKTWQEKLATSPATSTGNFMDILSLVSSLDNEL